MISLQSKGSFDICHPMLSAERMTQLLGLIRMHLFSAGAGCPRHSMHKPLCLQAVQKAAGNQIRGLQRDLQQEQATRQGSQDAGHLIPDEQTRTAQIRCVTGCLSIVVPGLPSCDLCSQGLALMSGAHW